MLTGIVRVVCELVGAELSLHCEKTLDDLTSEKEREKEFCFTPPDIMEILPRVSVCERDTYIPHTCLMLA